MSKMVPTYPYVPKPHQWSVTRFRHKTQHTLGDMVEYIGVNPEAGSNFTLLASGKGGVTADCYHITFTPKHAVDKVFAFKRLHAQVLTEDGSFSRYFTQDIDYRRVEARDVPASIIAACREDWVRAKGYG